VIVVHPRVLLLVATLAAACAAPPSTAESPPAAASAPVAAGPVSLAAPADVLDLYAQSAAAVRVGQFDDALATGRRAAAAAGTQAGDSPMLQLIRLQEAWVLLRFGRWAEAAGTPRPPASHRFETALWHYVQGAAAAEQGQVTDAQAALDALERAAASLSPHEMISRTNRATDLLVVARYDLTARIMSARRDLPVALLTRARAVAAADRLTADELPAWPLPPAREALGAALLSAGSPEQAEAVYRKDLEQHADNPRSLRGLADSLDRQGRTADAAAVRARFEDIWRDAPP